MTGTTACNYFNANVCRSCSWIANPYSDQILAKEDLVRATFPGIQLLPTVIGRTLGFRNKAKMAVTGTMADPKIGIFGKSDSLDDGHALLDCPVHHEKLNKVFQAMPDFIREHRIEPYRIREKKGELKGLIAFYSPGTDQMLLRFVLRSRESIERLTRGIPALQTRFPSLVSVTANLQPVPHAILEGDEEILLGGRFSMDHLLEGHSQKLKVELYPNAFVQTNAEIAGRLYETAAEWISEISSLKSQFKSQFKIVELYAGQGAFSFFAGLTSRETDRTIVGMEINAAAVDSANKNAERLNLPGVHFRCDDAEHVLNQVKKEAPDLILVNPPRRGLGSGVQILTTVIPSHLIYSSCSLDSLKSDLSKLEAHFKIQKLQIFDMFPHTEHFEVLAQLERR